MPRCCLCPGLYGSAFQDGVATPSSSKRILVFVNNALLCALGKDDVTNRINVRVRAACVDKFTMVQMLFLNQNLCDFATCRQARSQFF